MAIAIFSLYFIFLVFSSASSVFSNPSAMESLFPQRRQFENGEFLVRRRRADDSSKTSLETDPICKDVNAYYDQDKEQALKNSTSEFLFDEQLLDVVISYVGTESPIFLVLEQFDENSGLWRSSNSGKSFEKNGTSVLEKLADLKQDESLKLYPKIFEHPKFKDYVIMLGLKLISDGFYQPLVFLSEDTAQSFVCHPLHFVVPSYGVEINVVWHRDDVNKILLNCENWEISYSDNRGQDWTSVDSYHVGFASFRYPKDQTYESQSSIFYLFSTSSSHFRNRRFNLIKYDLRNRQREIIAENVQYFGIQGDTLYASINDSSNSTHSMHISRDGGLRWFQTNLEHLAYGQFYSVLDTESEIMFVHVDCSDLSDWGVRRGTLYISDSDMLVFTISLANHAYVRRFLWSSQPLNDFYPVSGMKGTFITTVLKDGGDLITMISFNRGVSWTVPEVANVSDCNNCRFWIYNKVAQRSRPIIGDTPLSEMTAPGLILANAFYENSTVSFDFTFLDLFLSKNGGYSWTKIKEGPHLYEILDQGGMLVAAGTQNKSGERLLTNSISISFDEGTCWIDVPFTEKEVFIIDIFSEPTKSSTKVNIWAEPFDQSDAYDSTMYTVDLSSILNVCDQDKDYKEWVPHSENGQDGCLLGSKETFRRRKPESFCRNGEAFEGDAVVKEEICTCTQADWECNIGYVQPKGSQKCVPSSEKIFLDVICNESSIIETVQFPAYRKLPGDKCEGGVLYEPEENTFTTQELCRGISSLDFKAFKPSQHHHKGAIKMGPDCTFLLVSIGLLFFLISVGAVCYFGRRAPTSVTLSHKVITDDHDFTSQQKSENTNGSTELNLHVGNVNSSQRNLNRNAEVILKRLPECFR